MAQYISKDVLVAEINKRIEDYKSHKIDDSYHDGLIFALEDLRDDFINTLEVKEVQEEPTSEQNLSNVQRTVKNWKETVSEELEEEIRKYLVEYKGYPHVMDETEKEMVKIARHFAKWQKKQMMSKAIDGEVGYWNQRGLSVFMELPRELEEDDKCKVIIIKED